MEQADKREFYTRIQVIVACASFTAACSMSIVQALNTRRLHPVYESSWLRDEFNRSGGGPLFTKPILGHYGCVNALEFSNGPGELLASGKQSK